MEYVDDMVIDGFFNAIECSLKFLLDNTGGLRRTCIFMMFTRRTWGGEGLSVVDSSIFFDPWVELCFCFVVLVYRSGLHLCFRAVFLNWWIVSHIIYALTLS